MLAITALDDEQSLERMTSDEARAQTAIFRTIRAYALRGGGSSASGMPRECERCRVMFQRGLLSASDARGWRHALTSFRAWFWSRFES